MWMKNQRVDLRIGALVLFCFSLSSGQVFAENLKKTIAVSRFENKTGDAAVGEGMADQLADALIHSKKFVVLERQTLEDVIAEQDIAASGRAEVSQTAKTGKLVPSQILIKGTVTEFEAEQQSGGSGISFSGVSLGSSKVSAHVAVILRIIDTTSGQVLDSVRVEGKAQGKRMKIGLQIQGVGLGSEDFKKTPLGEATQIAIDKAVLEIAKKLEQVPFEGKIIKITDADVYTNIGSRNDVKPGAVFDVYSHGEGILDPDTGEDLGAERTKVGTIRIASVEEKFSKAVTESGGNFEKGFILTQTGAASTPATEVSVQKGGNK